MHVYIFLSNLNSASHPQVSSAFLTFFFPVYFIPNRDYNEEESTWAFPWLYNLNLGLE